MYRQIPNILTALRFPLTGIFLYGFLQPPEEVTWRLTATGCFLLSALTDLLDGIIARRTGSVTRIGAFLDPLADKFQVLAGFFALWMRPDMGWGKWEIVIVISVLVIVFREAAITAYRSYKLAKRKPVVTSLLAKAKTMTQMITLIVAIVALAVANLFHWSHWSLSVLIGGGIVASAILAALSAVDYIRR